MKNKVLIFLAIIIVFAYGVYENVLNRPFPFISMEYSTYSEFNAPPHKLNINIDLDLNQTKTKELKAFIKKFKKLKLPNLDDDIKAATLATREIMHTSRGKCIRQISEIISKDEKYLMICSESSKIFVSLMQSINYSSRVIWMNGHTISEVYTKENGWILIDTYGNIVFKDKDGQYQGILDINKNYNKLSIFKIVDRKYDTNPDYLAKGQFNKELNVYKKQNLFVIIDGKSLDNFHMKTRKVDSILNFSILNNPFATGIQYLKEDSKKVGNVGISFHKRF